MVDNVELLTPPGRLIMGGTEPQGKVDFTSGQPKTDPATGLQIMEYFIGIAIPKQGEANWWDTSWGAVIMQKGFMDFPNGQPSQAGFSWKIGDGDSTVPNAKGKVPAQQPGSAGHWIVMFTTLFAPQHVNENGSAPVDPSTIYRGCWVQVHANVRGNGQIGNPGVYLNHDIISFQYHGERMHSGADAGTVGFGGNAMPAGASATPIAGMGQPQMQPQGQPMGQPQMQPQGQPMGQPQMQPQGQPMGQPQMQPQGQPQMQPQGQPMGQPMGQPQNNGMPAQGQPVQNPGQPQGPYYGAMNPAPNQ